MRVPGEHDFLTDPRRIDAKTDLLDGACGFVAEGDRRRVLQLAGDHFEVGVADAGRADPDQDTAGRDVVYLDVFDFGEHPGQWIYLGAYVVFLLVAIPTVLHYRRTVRSADPRTRRPAHARIG